jgi:hypothetical protein
MKKTVTILSVLALTAAIGFVGCKKKDDGNSAAQTSQQTETETVERIELEKLEERDSVYYLNGVPFT